MYSKCINALQVQKPRLEMRCSCDQDFCEPEVKFHNPTVKEFMEDYYDQEEYYEERVEIGSRNRTGSVDNMANKTHIMPSVFLLTSFIFFFKR